MMSNRLKIGVSGIRMELKKLLFNVIFISGLAVSLIFISTALLMPILYKLGFLYAGDIMNDFLGRSCHQIPSRSFMLFGYPVGLCIRCFAIYSGFSFCSIYLLWKGKNNIPNPLIGIALIAFMFIDLVIRQITGFFNGANTLRLITGISFGVGSSVLIINLRSGNYKFSQGGKDGN